MEAASHVPHDPPPIEKLSVATQVQRSPPHNPLPPCEPRSREIQLSSPFPYTADEKLMKEAPVTPMEHPEEHRKMSRKQRKMQSQNSIPYRKFPRDTDIE